MAKEEIIKEWFGKGQKDIDDAEFLLKNDRALENVAYHTHQAAEKYLKGFLLHNGWKLERVHDLVKLLEEAIRIDKSLNRFATTMRKITNFYIESRYPIGYEVKYTKQELKKAIKEVKAMISLILKK